MLTGNLREGVSSEQRDGQRQKERQTYRDRKTERERVREVQHSTIDW